MKNILIISHSASLTGAPILVHDIANRLDKKKYNVNFVVGDDGPLVGRFEKIGRTYVDPIYPDELKYWREIKRARSRIKLLRTLRPDLLFCNTIHPAKWLVYARLLGIPTLTHVLELSQAFKTISLLEHQMIKRCSDRFIAASEAVKRHLVEDQSINPEKIQVVYAGVDVQRFGKDEGVRELKKRLDLENCIVVGTVGRIAHVKGSDLFVRLAAMLKKKHSLTHKVKYLVVATTADKEYYKQFVEKLGEHRLLDDVVVVEDVPDTAPYFSAMDIYVTTAREDPFPVVILEAMASRKPVAGFATGGIPEAVTPECGVLVESENIEALSKEISSLIADPHRRAKLGVAARERVEEWFTSRRYADEVEGIIRGMVSTG